MVIAGATGYPEERHKVDRGEHGWVMFDAGKFETQPANLISEVIAQARSISTRAPTIQNFLDCVRTRTPTITPAEVAHRSASVRPLSVIAIELDGRSAGIRRPETSSTTRGERLLSRSYRKPGCCRSRGQRKAKMKTQKRTISARSLQPFSFFP